MVTKDTPGSDATMEVKDENQVESQHVPDELDSSPVFEAVDGSAT